MTKDTGPDARNLYQGYDIAFRTEENFRQFLKDYGKTRSYSGVSDMKTGSCRSTNGTR